MTDKEIMAAIINKIDGDSSKPDKLLKLTGMLPTVFYYLSDLHTC
jgi:hypothetical protein